MAYPVIDQFGLDKYLAPPEAPAAAGAVPKTAPVAAGMKIPSWLKSAGKFLGRAAVPLTVASQVGGAVSAAADSTTGATFENRPERALKILGGMDVTGLGARIGRVATGGDWSEPDVNPIVGPSAREFMARGPGATPAPPQVGSVPATAQPPVIDESVGPGGWANDPARRAAQLEVEQLQIQRDALAQRSGVGARYQPRTAAGGFMQAALGMKDISGTNAARVAAAKAASDAALKAAQAGEAGAKTSEIGARMGLGAQAKARGASEAEVAGIVSGRPVSDIYKESVTSMPGKQGEVTLISGRTGAVQKVIPTAPVQKITGAHVDAALGGSMKGKTRAQVIQAYKDKGYDVSGIK